MFSTKGRRTLASFSAWPLLPSAANDTASLASRASVFASGLIKKAIKKVTSDKPRYFLFSDIFFAPSLIAQLLTCDRFDFGLSAFDGGVTCQAVTLRVYAIAPLLRKSKWFGVTV